MRNIITVPGAHGRGGHHAGPVRASGTHHPIGPEASNHAKSLVQHHFDYGKAVGKVLRIRPLPAGK